MNKKIFLISILLCCMTLSSLFTTTTTSLFEDNLILTYLFDKKTNVLILKWNREVTFGKHFFIYRRKKEEKRYTLMNPSKPIYDNFFMISLEDNIGANFIISEKSKLSRLPDDITIVSYYPIDNAPNQFKKLKGDSTYQSNEIIIKVNEKNKSTNLNIFEVYNDDESYSLTNPFNDTGTEAEESDFNSDNNENQFEQDIQNRTNENDYFENLNPDTNFFTPDSNDSNPFSSSNNNNTMNGGDPFKNNNNNNTNNDKPFEDIFNPDNYDPQTDNDNGNPFSPFQ